MSKLLNTLFGLIWLVPVLLAVFGCALSLRLSRRRWIVHILVLSAVLFALPAFIYLQGISDPTTILGPGPGDGWIVLFYLTMLVPSSVVYAIFAWASYRERKRNNLSSLPTSP
jgi:hypothetical protein